MVTLLTLVYLTVSVILIGLVLVQHGKGAEAGASFGAGASGTVFGAQGSANFLSRSTALLAVVFFAISLLISNLNNSHSLSATKSQFEDLSKVEQIAPVVKEQNNEEEHNIPE